MKRYIDGCLVDDPRGAMFEAELSHPPSNKELQARQIEAFARIEREQREISEMVHELNRQHDIGECALTTTVDTDALHRSNPTFQPF